MARAFPGAYDLLVDDPTRPTIRPPAQPNGEPARGVRREVGAGKSLTVEGFDPRGLDTEWVVRAGPGSPTTILQLAGGLPWSAQLFIDESYGSAHFLDNLTAFAGQTPQVSCLSQAFTARGSRVQAAIFNGTTEALVLSLEVVPGRLSFSVQRPTPAAFAELPDFCTGVRFRKPGAAPGAADVIQFFDFSLAATFAYPAVNDALYTPAPGDAVVAFLSAAGADTVVWRMEVEK